jgi:hypothetical protein
MTRELFFARGTEYMAALRWYGGRILWPDHAATRSSYRRLYRYEKGDAKKELARHRQAGTPVPLFSELAS